MSQWGQTQPGYQYPLQTGFQGTAVPQFQQQNPQFQQQQPQFQQQVPPGGPAGFGNAPLLAQPTGFQQQQQQRLQGFQQQPQQTGFQPQPSGFLQAQPTGFAPGFQQQQTRALPTVPPVPPIPPVPSIPPQFQQQQQLPNQTSNLLGPPQGNRSLLGASQGITAPSLVPQATGFPGRPIGGPLVAQPTGYVDPRLQMMSTTFMPVNNTSFGAAPQLAPQPQFNLQQSFQQHNRTTKGNASQPMPWALTKAEKKQYDNIFRSWDAQGTGFISGQTALEVFGASGLPKEDLARIWTLADVDDRGKLNIAEFHVAMGLIYRRLSGMPIPDQLPSELVPPSARDLDNSVDILKDLLKNESRNRSPSNLDVPVSRLKSRSFNSSSSSIESGRDATIYKHNDSEPPGGFYHPRSRHIDRDSVRSKADEDNPAADLQEMKRMLANTATMLEKSAEADAARTAEDEVLEREMEEMRYRVKRLNEDLEYVSRPPRSIAKDQEKRKLERELMSLMHERIPELEKKIKDREERREREKRQWIRDRDRANERFGRFDVRDDDSLRRYDDHDRDRPYSRGAYDRDRDRDRGWERDRDMDRDSYRRSERSRSRERERERPPSPPRQRSPPPPPAMASASLIRDPPPAPSPPKTPAPMKNMTPEERKAYAQEQARRRIEERKAALGIVAPSSPSPAPAIDASVEDRLQQEKREAEEKARQAEKQAEERERLRRERLESEMVLKGGKSTPSPTSAANPPVPTPTTKTPTTSPPAPTPTPRMAPPAPRRAPAPPPPRNPRTPPAPPSARQTPATPPAAKTAPTFSAVKAAPAIDPEDEALRAREEALRKQREERLEKIRRLEREEEAARLEEQRKQEEAAAKAEEERKQAKAREERAARIRQMEAEEEAARIEEEKYQARLHALKTKTSQNFAPPKAPSPPPAPKTPTPPLVVTQAPPPPPAPPAPTPTVDTSKSTNPFSRLINQSGAASQPATPAISSAATISTNPWARAQTAPPPTTKSPGPKPYNTAPSSIEDDWDDIKENEEDDSSEDELAGRGKREDIARQLFGGILPSSRPQSTGPSGGSKPTSPSPVQSPSVVAMATAAGAPPPPPPPPSAPAAPAVVAPVPVSAPGDRSDLLRSIQGGAKLRPTKTIDKSGPQVSGHVLGDSNPPTHINAAPRAPSPPAPAPAAEPAPLSRNDPSSDSSNRQSVGWFADRAADAGAFVQRLPSTNEEEEEDYVSIAPIPSIHVEEASGASAHDPMADINQNTEYRVRSLFAYESSEPNDLAFGENLVLNAHPSKTDGDWWYGTLVTTGKSGLFPKTYVEIVKPVKAKALYTYTGNNADELPFTEGDELSIIDKSDSEWWKAEQGGVVFIVPATYLEVVEVPSDEPIDIPNGANVSPGGATDPLQHGDLHSRVESGGSLSDSDNEEIGDMSLAESGDDSDCSDYLSFDESDGDQYPETKAERETRAHERQLVLQAAGLILAQDDKPPASVIRARSIKRRPPPAAPHRSSTISTASSMKDLPPVPASSDAEEAPGVDPEAEEPVDHAQRLDDAYARYEAFRNSQLQSNRLSVASVDTIPSPTGSTFSTSTTASPPAPSKEGDHRTYSHLLSFLGRSKTPEGERRSTANLNISGPITSAEASSPSNNAAFGSSWASLVDKTALDGIPVDERRRQEVIFELINTEAAYVRDLQLIVEIFYSSMVPLLSQKEVTVIFANIEDILLTNTAFLSSLEERQKECRLYIDNIADVLLDHLPQMKVYTQYCVNQATAIKVLASLRESKPELAVHLQSLRDDPAVRNLDLSSYLLVPMQRITRYPLLIKQILHHTNSEEEKKRITYALETSEKLLEYVNEAIRDQEGRETLKAISKKLWIGQGHLDLSAPTRYMGERKLIKEGLLVKTKSGRKLYAFLCSDILVLTDASLKTLYKMPIPLTQVKVKEVHPGREDTTFQITQAYPRGGDSISLKAATHRESQAWVHEIEYASRRCRHAEDRAARKQRK